MTEEIQDLTNLKENIITSKQKKSSLKTSLTILSGLTNIGITKNRNRGLSVLGVSILYTISVIMAFIYSVYRSNDYIYFNFRIDLNSNIINEFNTDRNFLFVIVWLIILNNFFFMFCYFYNYKEEDLLSDIYKNISFSYVLSLLFLSISTILGIIFNEYRFTNLLINSLIHLISIGFLYNTYIRIKQKKNLHYTSYISFFVYLSLLLCYLVYVVLYGTCNCILFFLDDLENNTIQIIVNVLFCVVATLLITYYKDVYFSGFYIILLVGHMINVVNQGEFYTLIILLIFTIFSVLLTLYKHKYNAFGFVNPNEIDNILLHHEFYNSSKRKSQEII